MTGDVYATGGRVEKVTVRLAMPPLLGWGETLFLVWVASTIAGVWLNGGFR